jgi:hypothetical protein
VILEHPMLLFHQTKAIIAFSTSSNQQQSRTESKFRPDETSSSKVAAVPLKTEKLLLDKMRFWSMLLFNQTKASILFPTSSNQQQSRNRVETQSRKEDIVQIVTFNNSRGKLFYIFLIG